jgi:hypothetical protein
MNVANVGRNSAPDVSVQESEFASRVLSYFEVSVTNGMWMPRRFRYAT